MSGARISFFADAPVKVNPATTTPVAVARHDERAFLFTVHPTEDLVMGSLYARLDYRAGGTAHIQTTAIKVSNRALPDADAIVAMSVEGALDTLQQRHNGTVNLILTNKSTAPIAVVSVKPSGPSTVTFKPTAFAPAQPLQIPPRQTRMLVFEVEANERVIPGKYLLVFTSDVRISTAGGIDVTSVATKEINIGVFGESQVLQVLSVPSFLLLPGFLVLITAKMLWDRHVFRKSEDGTFPWTFPSPEFWVLAIMISGAAAFIYPLFGQPSYLEGYGPTDVALVWLGAVVLGAVLYLGPMWTRRKYLDAQAAKLFSASDDERTTLLKLAAVGARVELPRYRLTIDGAEVSAFRVNPDAKQIDVWVFPAMQVTPTTNIGDSYDAISSAANARNTVAAMLESVGPAVEDAKVTLKWRAQGAFDGPRLVKWVDAKPTFETRMGFVVLEEPEIA